VVGHWRTDYLAPNTAYQSGSITSLAAFPTRPPNVSEVKTSILTLSRSPLHGRTAVTPVTATILCIQWVAWSQLGTIARSPKGKSSLYG